MRDYVRYGDETTTFEKFRNRRNDSQSRRSSRPKRQRSFNAMVQTAQRRIIAATQRIGHGFVQAENPKQAVQVLKRWVRANDGRIGKGPQVFEVLRKAFLNLLRADVFEYEDPGYRLNLA